MKWCAGLLLFVLIACTKESVTFSDTYFVNTTGHVINVTAYYRGVANSDASFVLQTGEKKNVFSNNTRGIADGLTYGYANYPNDSIVVTFDNNYRMAHYKHNLIGLSSKNYLYSSRRNIYNDTSYVVNVRSETKQTRRVEFTYTFTEQDYQDAK